MRRLLPLLLLWCLLLVDSGQLAAASDPGPLPVTAADPTWGDATAPVTIMGFSDLECPYCDRVLNSLDGLQSDYGQQKIRIVHKHFPLPFHDHAMAAAEVGAAIRTLEGSDAFFRYQRAILSALKSDRTPLDVARDLSLDDVAIEKLVDGGTPRTKVDEDVALGKTVGVRGTPAFFVNGIFLGGAQPKQKFAELIDAQLIEADKLRKKGVAAQAISLQLTRENVAAHAGMPGFEVWQVPVGKSPQLGPSTALVTWVMFSEYQCPYCGRLMPTITQLRAKYGARLRVVFKHFPLPSHPRAHAAAELAAEAHARRGNDGFWQATDELFASQHDLEDADLERIAKELRLDPQKTLAAIGNRDHDETIEEDQLLARDLLVTGTPTSFINGRRVSGYGQPDKFEKVIDEEIVKANALIAKGISKQQLYAHIMKSAKGPPAPPTTTIPPVDAQTPVRGAATAKVTLQVFVDFESGFWLNAVPALDRLERDFKGKLRIAFRHKPLPFHDKAARAHEAAAEAFAQQGNAGFWKLYQRLVDHPHDLEERDLLEHAAKLGLDQPALLAAWKDGRHRARITADITLADDRNLSSVPGYIVNGYALSGAKTYLELRRVVERALAD